MNYPITCTCGNQESEYVLQFLMGLNDSFAHIHGPILLLDPLPSFTKVFSLILQDEEQRKTGNSSLSALDQIDFSC